LRTKYSKHFSRDLNPPFFLQMCAAIATLLCQVPPCAPT